MINIPEGTVLFDCVVCRTEEMRFGRPPPVAGLVNYSQLCYVNSLLQLLATMPEYMTYLTKLKSDNASKKTEVLSQLEGLLREINNCEFGAKIEAASRLCATMVRAVDKVE